MKTHLLPAMIAAALTLGVASSADAYDSVWCSDGDRFYKPECAGGGGPHETPGVQVSRIINACGTGIDVEFTYPFGASSDMKRPPVLLLHGGGVDPAYWDQHGALQHPANPYNEMARGLAMKSMVVIQPYWPVGPTSTPWDDADKAARIVSCIADGTDPNWCPTNGGCLPGNLLLGAMSWTHTDRSNLLVIGHSAGGISSLYLPEKLGSGLRGIILIDAAKGSYTQNPPKAISSGTPIVHFYPDYHGPLQNAANSLFRLGAPNTCVGGSSNGLGCVGAADCPSGTCTGAAPTQGSWVPIGIRDSAAALAANKRDANHCMALEEGYSWNQTKPGDHYAYCMPGTPNCLRNPPNNGNCGGATHCGQNKVCQNNPNLKAGSGLAWGDGTAQNILHRYVLSYASCLVADYGAYYQPWVTGSDRFHDDTGNNPAFCEVGLRPWGMTGGANPNPTCSLNTNVHDCWAANCHWVKGQEGRVVRINNAQVVSEYTTTADRWYGAYERFNTPTAGAFTERQEKLSGTPGQPTYIKCNAGPANF